MAELEQEEIGLLLDAFSDKAESWKAEHAEAMRCSDLEDALVFGIAVHFAISTVDLNWHDAVFSGRAEFSRAEELEIENFYRAWIRNAEFFASRLDQMESAGYSVKRSDLFRRAYREAIATQTPGSELL